ncbi:MAG: hypothetical protein IJY36_03250 [Coprobacter sp.]|nr:hypothetical protein [Coprobacter sp.]
MKRIHSIILLILLIFGCVSVDSRAQDRPAPKKNVKVPEWFLAPAQGEYVGVSIPSVNEQEAIPSAIMSALMAYAAHNPTPTDTVGTQIESISSVSGEKEQSMFKAMINREVNPTYDIVRSHMGDNGELFIAIKIFDENSPQDTFSIKCVNNFYTIGNSSNPQESVTNIKDMTILTYTHEGIIPQALRYSHYQDYVEENGKETYSYKIAFAEKKNNVYGSFISTEKSQAYSYKSTWKLRKGILEYMPVADCRNSLHVAYMCYLSEALRNNSVPVTPLYIIENSLVHDIVAE